jgi:hypothetical protein
MNYEPFINSESTMYNLCETETCKLKLVGEKNNLLSQAVVIKFHLELLRFMIFRLHFVSFYLLVYLPL